MDFTLQKYRTILEAANASGYRVMGIRDWYDRAAEPDFVLLVRHDVDRQPENARAMARLERELGVKTSYYFRSLPCSFVPEIIEEIRSLGHEVGYHYEDWSLAGFDKQKAIGLFSANLARMRQLVPVSSIAMHGSPLSRQSNLTIWKHCDFREWDVIDAIESIDYRGFAFFTDAGRTFGATSANLRDYLRNEDRIEGVNSSDDLVEFLRQRRYARVHIGVHPERWNAALLPWVRQWTLDRSVNGVKRMIGLLRSGS